MKQCSNCGYLLSLTKKQVMAIYEAKLPAIDIAKQAEVSRQTVYKIKQGLLYQNVTKHIRTLGWKPASVDEVADLADEWKKSR